MFRISVDGSRDFAWIPSQFLTDEYLTCDAVVMSFAYASLIASELFFFLFRFGGQ